MWSWLGRGCNCGGGDRAWEVASASVITWATMMKEGAESLLEWFIIGITRFSEVIADTTGSQKVFLYGQKYHLLEPVAWRLSLCTPRMMTLITGNLDDLI